MLKIKDMKAHTASIINAIILIILGLWGYFGSETPSLTAWIPVIGGVLLIILYPGTKKEDKIISHITVTVTLLIFLGLFKPLLGAIDRADTMALIRVLIMMATGIFAMIYFIKSFIDARKNREEA
jgi:sulfite exporter TauE/SafE